MHFIPSARVMTRPADLSHTPSHSCATREDSGRFSGWEECMGLDVGRNVVEMHVPADGRANQLQLNDRTDCNLAN